ncbi:metallophosphoesterase [Treponema primitia]|uniref:metallophosphoesterase n=1 Tax=Treponema primitia TaxID=88058 RepID=UPI00397F9766
MKILCISDQIDPLVYSSAIKERFKDVDMVLSAGDLPMDYLDFIISSLNRPLLFVFGNHNLEDLNFFNKEMNLPAGRGFGATHIGSRIVIEEGMIVAGLGGSMRYNRGENQFTNFQMYMEIFKLIPAMLFNRLFRGRFLDVLLTHASPMDIHDRDDPCHRGFKAFLWFMRVFKPKYLVHGHIHLYDLSAVRTTGYNKTQVINAYSHYIIDTGENKL